MSKQYADHLVTCSFRLIVNTPFWRDPGAGDQISNAYRAYGRRGYILSKINKNNTEELLTISAPVKEKRFLVPLCVFSL